MIISGRYNGSFPDALKISGNLADMSNFVIDLKVQRAKDLPLDRVMFLTWFCSHFCGVFGVGLGICDGAQKQNPQLSSHTLFICCMKLHLNDLPPKSAIILASMSGSLRAHCF